MKAILPVLLLFFCLHSYGQNNGVPKKLNGKFSMPQGLIAKDYRPGVLIVKFKPDNSKQSPSGTNVKASIPVMPLIQADGVKILSVSKRFADVPVDGNISAASKAVTDNGLDRIYEVKFSGNITIEALINQLLKDERIEYAEPDYIYHTNFIPDDPRYIAGNQAYLDLVKAPLAWDLIRNSSTVVIGIIDSGSDLNHEDLAANIYTNAADPINGIDDDRDGYIDNFRGWDLVGASGANIAEDNDPNVRSDTTEHGVHVSGIAGAVTNNGKGVSSVSFNAKLLIVKCGADNNGNSIYRGYDGIKYAADHGAQIINCSWGGSGGGSFGQDIINYAISKGCLVVAAAGNAGASTSDYPAAYTGVLSVANSTLADIKSNSSNFGTNVSISAPGVSILSTLWSNRYGTFSGTSMSSPMVAAAAALVKSQFPNLTMQQVGERLRSTSDNIDSKNPNFAGLLGKGRLNLYRALTESPPSIRYQKIDLSDQGNGNIPAGETFSIYFDLKNFLSPVNALQVKLSSANTNVTVTDADQTVASITTNETKTMVGPFKVFVKAGTPDNTTVTFKLDYLANNGAFADSETFKVTVALDYLNIQVNKIWTTMTSNGRVGYSLPNAVNGLGLVYNAENLLYETSLMVGRSGTQFSDNVRTGNSSNEHFVKKVRVSKTAGTTAAFEGRSEFDDSGNFSPQNIYVKQTQLAFSAAPDDKYSLIQYEITNTTTIDMTGVYIGLFNDFDVAGGTTNFTKYDAVNRLAYVANKGTSSLYGGIKLLSTNAPPAYYPISYQVAGDPLSDNNFTATEKFTTLSSGIKSISLGETASTGYDVMFVSGYGPYTIPAKSSVKVAFAILAGNDLADLQASAVAAQTKHDLIFKEEAVSESLILSQNFPNPVNGKTTIEYSIPKTGMVNVGLYDLAGRKVKTYVNELMGPGLHTLEVNSYDLQNGLYIYRILYNNEEKALKMVVAR